MAKTDKLDAQDIAHFGESVKPALSALKSKELRDISDLLTLRSQHLEMSTMQKNRLKRMPESTQKSIRRVLKTLEKEIAWVDQQLDKPKSPNGNIRSNYWSVQRAWAKSLLIHC